MKSLPNIFLVGPMGAGKTSVGRAVAILLSRPFFDSDVVLTERAGATISWIFEKEGEEGMRQREIKVINDLTQLPLIVLATGGGSILKPENRHALATRGTVFYLQASIEQQVERTKKARDHRPLLHVPNPREKIIELYAHRAPLYESIADFSVLTGRGPINTIAEQIVEYMHEHR